MNISGNETFHFAQSSRELKHSNINSEINTPQNNIQKCPKSPGLILKTKKVDQYLSLYPKNKEKEKEKNKLVQLSLNPELETTNKIKPLKNTFISLQNPLRHSFKNFFNAMNYPYSKNSQYINRHKLSTDSLPFFTRRRNSHHVQFLPRNSKKNLKQVQRELQFKLLDMSIQIENDSDNDDNYLNPETPIQRKQKKRFTDYSPNNNNKHISFKTIKTGYYNNINPNKSNNDLRKGTTSSSINPTPKNKPKIAGRRQSFMPICTLADKFEPHNQSNNNKLNLSVNMNLYRDLFPNINGQLSSKELTNINNINNKSMRVSKKKINIKKILLYSLKNEEFENKYRLLTRQKELYDSFEDEEVIEELEDEYFFISPETYHILIFDTLILLCTLFSCFYLPIYIAQSKCFCSLIPKAIKVILFFNEFINIIDIGLSFFRAYYNFEFTLIKNTERIIIHYLKKFFFPDLISAIPFFTISYYFCNYYKEKPDGEICFFNGVDMKFNFIKMAFGFKMIKLIKVLDKKANRGINTFYEVISENYTLEKTMKMLLFTILCVIGFNFFICYHIYIGTQSYPNWILKTNLQDASFITKYITSFYFLIATITSVGYGDITCISLSETFYQIIILTIGVVAYSWIVSTIGNYVKKETRAAIKFNKDLSLLEDIRVSYPKMNFKLYNKIYKHLETVSHQQEKLDTNLLVTNLPYTLKNQIMFIIYGSIIKKFKFFKDCENSDFILRVLTAFIPLSTKKGAFIIQEGEIIDNIVFVREGRLSLVATIDLDSPTASIENYLGEKFEDINEKYNTKVDNSLMDESTDLGLKKEKVTTVLKTVLKTKEEIEEDNIEQEMAKKDFNGEDIEIGNMQFLNILDILKNEHYGIVYMFLKKPSPLSLRVKSKYCQLFLLRKNDTIQISKAYPNVWKKIYYKSYHNMKSIKKMTRRVIINYCKSYGYKYKKDILEELDTSKKEDTDLFFKLGLINSRKRRNTNNKGVGFNLDINKASNKNVIKPKSILRYSNKNDILDLNSNKSLYSGGYSKLKTENFNFKKKFSDSQSNSPLALTQSRPNTNINKNISIFSSRNRLSSLIGSDEQAKTRMNQINQINNINYNIVINDLDMNNDSKKSLLKKEEIKQKSSLKKSIKNFPSITSLDKDLMKKSNFMQNIPSKIKGLSGLQKSKNNLNYYNPNNNLNNLNIPNSDKYNAIVTLNTPNNNIVNTNTNTNTSKNNTVEINTTEEKKSEQSPNTINDLSRKLIKKVKKKIKKRRKKKKLYKMLLQKIAESLANNISHNANSSSSMNNNSIILSSKIGEVISMNPDINYIIDEQPELNPNNMSQNINNNINDINDINNMNMSHNLNQNNQFHFPQMNTNNEFVTFHNPNELFLIPEDLEITSSETSSSENSSESNNNNNSEKKEEKNSNNNNNNSNNKLNEVPQKKEIILSISENTNFTLNNTYDNLNKLSEGNYSKDDNLQKSVIKLIKVYLSEKNKPDTEKEKEKTKTTTLINDEKRSSIFKSPKIKDIQKEKEENKEKDVWSFLDNENSKNNNSFEKTHYKSPQVHQKKTNDFSKRKKNKDSMYDNLFNLDETPKNKKTMNKKKNKNINKTALKKIIKRKKSKKKNTHNLQILKLHTLEKESDSEKKDEHKEEEKDNTIGSLDLSDLDDEVEQKGYTYVNKDFKTYQKFSKKELNNKNENNNENKKDSDNKG